MKVSLEIEDLGTLCICALRYCHGRMTYMPSLVRDIVRPLLPMLRVKELKVMADDCDFQRKCDLYGDEHTDKPGWLDWEREVKAALEKKERS